MSEFSGFGLAEPLLRALVQEGYREPTPIQKETIPPVMQGRDVLGIAQTGTGKTAAFALPILHALYNRNERVAPKHCQALILAPTRELATQIGESFRAYGRGCRLSVTVIVGGAGHAPQIKALARGIDIVVATPGRLIDHLEAGHLRLDHARIVVLDEADHMFDMGFLPPVRRIVKALPRERQNLFFSATMPPEIRALAKEMLTHPVEVTITPAATTAERVTQQVIFTETARKREILVELMQQPDFTRTLIFTRTKRGADRVARHLETAGLVVAAIHGDKSQGQRERALAQFKTGRIKALVATDIAARGIDIDQVSHVINYELPNLPESYVHRIGRTARAGESGVAISLCDDSERAYLRDIEKATRQRVPSVDRRSDGPRLAEPETMHSGDTGKTRRFAPPRHSMRPDHSRPDHSRPDDGRRQKPSRRQDVDGDRGRSLQPPRRGEEFQDRPANSNAPRFHAARSNPSRERLDGPRRSEDSRGSEGLRGSEGVRDPKRHPHSGPNRRPASLHTQHRDGSQTRPVSAGGRERDAADARRPAGKRNRFRRPKRAAA